MCLTRVRQRVSKVLRPEAPAADHIGAILAGLVRHYGLPAEGYLIDAGCGRGDLAMTLSTWLRGRYLGLDPDAACVARARAAAGRPGWRFEAVETVAIPEADGQADMVCFFSAFTRLPPEQGYRWLEDARRVLRPGGRIVLAFLEFTEPAHWRLFADTLAAAKAGEAAPPRVFIDRDALPVWAGHLGLDLVDLRGAGERVVAEGNLGQALCVMQKPR